jgi:alpha-L-rhamnosidase
MIKEWVIIMSLFPISLLSKAKELPVLSIERIKCEYRINPLGIDETHPRFSWIFHAIKRNQYQAYYRILVSSSPENLLKNIGDIWDSGKLPSEDNIQVYFRGKTLHSFSRYFWKVKAWTQHSFETPWSRPGDFETAFLSDAAWQGKWIGTGEKVPEKDEGFYKDIPAPWFRKTFQISKPIRSARLYISGLGYYEAYLNGNKIGDQVLDPAWTNYAKTILYSTYDITTQIKNGINTLAVLLGNGWYNPLPMKLFRVFNLRNTLTIGQPRMIADLRIIFKDGNSMFISSDESWETADSYILKNNVYLGEKQDGRMKKEFTEFVGASDMNWKKSVLTNAPGGKLNAQSLPPIRITKKILPISFSEPEKNVWVYDFGQNFAGWIRMKIPGTPGQHLHFRYGELIYSNGRVNGMTTVAGHIKEIWKLDGGPGSPKTAYQEDEYICKGDGKDIFQPHFTFHGFRYVEITGLTEKPNINSLAGLRLNSSIAENGEFNCSNPLFNQIQQITLWTFLSNIFSVQSDCPGREKQGYGADMVVSAEAFLFNFDMNSFYSKTVNDFKADARPNGGMPECAPYNGITTEGFDEGAGPLEWQLAFSFLQLRLYQFYGNKKIIEDNYEATQRMVAFLKSQSSDNLIYHGIGDHVSVEPKHIPLTSGAVYYQHVKILAAFAKILGKTKDEEQYESLTDSIAVSFNRHYLKQGAGLYDTSSNQVTQVFPLWNELVPEEEKQKAFNVLLNDIQLKMNGHLGTGIFGTKMLFDILRRFDRNEVAYTMVNTNDYPGYGYMLKNGATTLWETWEKPDQASWNHPMFGSVTEWFYRSLLGINPGETATGFDQIILKPFTGGDLSFASGYYQSIRGKIGSSWTRKNGVFNWEIEIPPNTRARICIPANAVTKIEENKKPVLNCPDLKFIRIENGFAQFDAVSGSYHFNVIQ